LNNAAEPIVTVVVPVYNAMPYLVTCLASVLEQSIGLGGMEVVAVDDGSTDGSGGQLDLLAACWNGLRVVHHEGSGGPSRPRNTGLDMATGRYVFFLDADDYLATQALERMLALAEEDGSDVVVCDRKEVGGRKLHVREGAKSRHNGKDTTVFKSWNNGPMCDYDMSMVAGSDCKHLYRRDRIERLGLRFPEGVNFGEDSMFATSYVEGAKISAVEDYCCYYERFRADGSNLTTWLAGSEMHLDALERAWRLKTDHQPRWMRDLLPREIILDLNQLVFNERFTRHDGEIRRRLVARAQALLATLPIRGVAARTSALDRLKLHLIGRAMEPELVELTRAMAQGQRGKDVIIGGRVYGAYPFFRDPAVGVPDECYDVTAELAVRQHLACLSLDGSRLRMAGHAYIEHVDAVAAGTAVVLRERAGGGEHRVPVQQVPVAGLAGEGGGGWYDYGLAGFDIKLDLSNIAGTSLSPGQWGVFIAVSAQGVSKEVPLGRHRAIAVDESVQSLGTGRFSAYFAKHGTLTLDVRGEPRESR
jgi:glycosyltransferase involved in cell wall biosynthesis